MLRAILYIINAIIAFGAGFFAYVMTMKVVWDQTLGGEWSFVLFYGGLAFFIVAVPGYFLVISLVDSKFDRFKAILYPLACMLVFFVPTLFILIRFWSVNLFLPEAMLFHSFFLTSGLVFGLGTWFIKKIA